MDVRTLISRSVVKGSLGVAALLALAPVANAALVNFDFTTLNGGANNTALANTETVNGVVAKGFVSNFATPAILWLRNQPNDHGLGVCSEGAGTCSTGGGDVNELDNSGLGEAILLERPIGSIWKELWVSSLDGGGTGGSEEGRIFWGNDLTNWSSAVFSFGDFGAAVEGNVLGLGALGLFDITAKYVLFAHPGALGTPESGTDNDYLVWKGQIETDAGTDVPLPAAAWLLLSGLAGLFGVSRRRAA